MEAVGDVARGSGEAEAAFWPDGDGFDGAEVAVGGVVVGFEADVDCGVEAAVGGGLRGEEEGKPEEGGLSACGV